MIYIGTASGIYRWFNNLPWPVFHALQDRPVVSLATGPGGLMAALDGSSRLAISRNSGLDWDEPAVPAGVGRPTHVRIAPQSGELILATAGPIAFYGRPMRARPGPARRPGATQMARRWLAERRRSGDAATAVLDPLAETTRRGWTRLGSPEVGVVGDLAGLTFLELGPDRSTWFAGIAGGGVFAGSDRASKWQPVAGLPAEVECLHADEKRLIVGTHDGLMASPDGREWAALGDLSGRRVSAVEVQPGDAKHLWAGVDAGGEGPGLFESKDGGATWKRVTRGFPEHLGSSHVVDIRYDQDDTECILVALSSGGLYRTKTDGLWWEPISRQLEGARVLAPAV